MLIVKKKLINEHIPIFNLRIYRYLCCMDNISLQPDMLVALSVQRGLLGWCVAHDATTIHGIQPRSMTSYARFVSIKRCVGEMK